MAFNRVILVGNIVADPELKTTPNGISVTRFRIAVNRRFTRSGEQAQTDFFDIVAWRQTAEFVSRFFTKGRHLTMPPLTAHPRQIRVLRIFPQTTNCPSNY